MTEKSLKKHERLIKITRAINVLRELLGYAKGQRDAYNQLDFEEKEKYQDMFTLREMIEGLKTADVELSLIKSSLKRELEKNE